MCYWTSLLHQVAGDFSYLNIAISQYDKIFLLHFKVGLRLFSITFFTETLDHKYNSGHYIIDGLVIRIHIKSTTNRCVIDGY